MMDPRLRVAKNTAALLILRLVVPLLSVAVVLVVSRLLGTEGLGRYTLAFTFLYFFNTIAPLGLYALITREGARDRACLEDLLANAVALGTCASLAVTAVMAGLAMVLRYDAPTQSAILLLSLAILPYTLGSFFEAAFTAIERMEYIAVSAFAENLLRVGLGVTLLLLGYGLDAVMVTAVIGRILACIVSTRLLARVGIRVRWAMDCDLLRMLAREAPTFLLISIFATLYWRIDVFMLAQLRPVEDVGYYGAAWRLLEIAIVVPQSLCLALYPQMANAIHRDLGVMEGLGQTAARYLLAVSLPAVVCCTLIAGPILVLLYGEPFRSAAPTLAVLMWTLLPWGWVRYHAYVLVAAGRQRIALALNVLMLAVNVLLNLVLIPRYSHLGAAIATLASVCVYGVIQHVYLQRQLPGHVAPMLAQRTPLIAAAVTALCIWLVRDHSVFLACGIVPVVYGATLTATGFFTAAELQVFGVRRVLQSVGLAARVK